MWDGRKNDVALAAGAVLLCGSIWTGAMALALYLKPPLLAAQQAELAAAAASLSADELAAQKQLDLLCAAGVVGLALLIGAVVYAIRRGACASSGETPGRDEHKEGSAIKWATGIPMFAAVIGIVGGAFVACLGGFILGHAGHIPMDSMQPLLISSGVLLALAAVAFAVDYNRNK